MNRDPHYPPSPLADYTYRVLIAVAIVVVVILAWRLLDIFVLVFGAIVLAAALRALSDPLERVAPLSPRAALIVVILLVLAALAGAFSLLGVQLVTQMRQLIEVLPDALERAREWLQGTRIGGALPDLGQGFSSTGAVAGIQRIASTTLGVLTNTVLIVFLAIFIAMDPGLYRRGLLRMAPHAARERIAIALDGSGEALKRWLLGQLVAMVSVGVVTFIGLSALGMPLALPLGLIVGLLEFIPFVGPIAAAIPAVLVAFAQGGWMPLYVAILYLAIQQLEGNVLMPLIQRWAVALPPALGLLSVVVFGVAFGPLGILFATPLMVVVMVFVKKLYVDTAIERSSPRKAAERE